jgi:predicted GNAT family acetyltransferase
MRPRSGSWSARSSSDNIFATRFRSVATLCASRYPGAPGHARHVEAADTSLFAEWLLAFFAEAVPNEPKPPRERIEQAALEGQYLFWVVDDTPVSMAGILRRTRRAAAIAGVYTPTLRDRGYAGSVTAATVERIFAEGRNAACLYTDLRNPMSNRGYAKIGFQPVCALSMSSAKFNFGDLSAHELGALRRGD